MDSKRENLIVQLTTDFAVKVVAFHFKIKKAGVIPMANQIFKSGTSIGANVREAQNAESKSDFIHKMKIAAKEADETEYWIQICERSPFLPDPSELKTEITSICRVLTKIISSSKINSSNFQLKNN
jgi:four helix bundle protein